MRIGSDGNDLWREINFDQTLMDCRTRYGDIKSSIEDAACAQGLELCLRVQPPRVHTTHSHRLGKRAQRIEQVGEVLSDAMSAAEDTEPEKERPNKLRRTRPAIDTSGIFIEAQSNTQVTACASAPVGRTPDALARSHLSCLTRRLPNRCTSRAVTTSIPPKPSLACFSDSLTISVLPKGRCSRIQLALLQAASSLIPASTY